MTWLTTKTTPKGHCPTCAAPFDAHTCMNHPASHPSPGSITVCIYCANVLVFGDNLTLRELSFDDLAELPEQTVRQVSQVQMAIRCRLNRKLVLH